MLAIPWMFPAGDLPGYDLEYEAGHFNDAGVDGGSQSSSYDLGVAREELKKEYSELQVYEAL